MTWLALLFIACGGGDAVAPSTSADVTTAPVTPGVKQPLIQPGVSTAPAAPTAAIDQSQCNTVESPAPDGDGLSGTITCGQTITGNTRGGVTRFGTRFYEKNFCTPATTNHDGGDERIYKFEMTNAPGRAFLTLDTPCGNVDMAAFKATGGSVPTEASEIQQCEMNVKGGTTREKIELNVLEATTWWIVVEGQGDEEGAFALTVQCDG